MGDLSRPTGCDRLIKGERSACLAGRCGRLPRRHERTDQPEHGDDDSDQEHHPVALPDRRDPERYQQQEIDDSQSDPKHLVTPLIEWIHIVAGRGAVKVTPLRWKTLTLFSSPP